MTLIPRGTKTGDTEGAEEDFKKLEATARSQGSGEEEYLSASDVDFIHRSLETVPRDSKAAEGTGEVVSRIGQVAQGKGEGCVGTVAMTSEDDCDQFKDHGALLFAGEHTSPLMPGTVHGAFLTGLDAALQVAWLLDVENPIDHVDPTLLRDLWIPECLQNFGINFGIPMTTSVLRLDEAEVLFDQLNSDLCVLGFWGVFDLCRSDFDDDTEL